MGASARRCVLSANSNRAASAVHKRFHNGALSSAGSAEKHHRDETGVCLKCLVPLAQFVTSLVEHLVNLDS